MRTIAWLGLLALSACQPAFAPLSTLEAPRVLAVRAEPAEAAPGVAVTLTAFTAAPSGAIEPPLSWSVCLTPKPPTENGVVVPACLTAQGTTPLGTTAAPLTVSLPLDACRRFGPDPPPPQAGQPPSQPRSPDPTGGYYQPLRVALGEASSVALVRLRCALAGASLEAASEYAARYHDNRNPSLAGIGASVDGQPLQLDTLPANRPVTLTARFAVDAAETFPVLDPQAQILVDMREALTVSWFVTQGSLARARSGRAGADATLTVDNVVTAPAGKSHLFLVLRDSRGGVDFAAYDLTFLPGQAATASPPLAPSSGLDGAGSGDPDPTRSAD